MAKPFLIRITRPLDVVRSSISLFNDRIEAGMNFWVYEEADEECPNPHVHGYVESPKDIQAIRRAMRTIFNVTGNQEYSLKKVKETESDKGHVWCYMCKGYQGYFGSEVMVQSRYGLSPSFDNSWVNERHHEYWNRKRHSREMPDKMKIDQWLFERAQETGVRCPRKLFRAYQDERIKQGKYAINVYQARATILGVLYRLGGVSQRSVEDEVLRGFQSPLMNQDTEEFSAFM